MDDFSNNFTTDIIMPESMTATTEAEVSNDEADGINWDTMTDSSGAALRGACACCSHQNFDFGHNKGKADPSTEIIIDAFDARSVDGTSTVLMLEDDFTNDVNTTGLLTADGTGSTGTIEVEGDTDWFALEVVAGTIYAIDSSTSDPAFQVVFNIIDDENNLITSNSPDSTPFYGETLIFTATETTTLFVEAEAIEFGQFLTGDYEVTAEVIVDDFSADVNTTGVLDPDEVFSAGTLEFEGDSDWFALNVVAGNLYTLDIFGSTIADDDLELSLYDNSGSFISATEFGDPLGFTATETTTLYVGASASDFVGVPITGDYELTAIEVSDDFSADINTTGVLASDGTVTTGNIDFAGDSDWFALDVVADESYVITVEGDDIDDLFLPVFINTFDLGIGLYDSAGTLLQFGPGFDSLTFTASETGTFFVEAEGVNFGVGSPTGGYSLSTVVFEDDFSADINTTGVLTADGTPVIGNFELENDEDWFALDVVQGEIYTVTFTSSEVLGTVDLELYDNTGSFVEDGSDTLTFTAQATETVFIQSDVFGSGTGEYELTATSIEAPEDDFTADVNTTGVLATDGTVTTGELEIAGDDDWFELTITEAQSVQINLTGVSLSDTYVYFHDSEGNLIAQNDDGGIGLNSQLILDLEAGTYYVSARAFSDSRTGTYELTANVIEDDFSADVNTTGELAIDGTVTTGTIDFVGDDDWFAIELTAGAVYSVALTSDTISSFDIDINLRGTSGDFFVFDNDDVLTFTASETGTFYVEVEGDTSGSNLTGDYELTANVIEDDDFSANVNTTGELTTDGTVTTGTIDFVSDQDWFAIELTEGELYSITLTSDTIAYFDLGLNLRDSSGDFIVGGNDTLTFEASETGTFYVDVQSYPFGFNPTGDYELTANVIEDDFSDDVNTTGILATDGTLATGTIDFVGDDDWFAIELTAGELYSIALTSDTIPLSDLDLNLRESSGNIISFDINDVLIFEATETGTFYVEVEDEAFGSNLTGDYELTANIVEDDFTADVNTTGALATDGTVTTGTIDFQGDDDWFAIELAAGEIYSIALTSDTISAFDLSLILRDSSGNIISFDNNSDENDVLAFAANETGAFYVEVEGGTSGSNLTGDYELTANIIEDDFTADVNTTGVLATDGTVTTGAIDFGGDNDWFAIEVTAGDLYSVVLTSDMIFAFDLGLNLSDGFGNIVALGNNSSGIDNTLTFTASETGTFYVDVQGNLSTLSTGNYELTAVVFTPPEDDFSADVNTTGELATDGTISTGTLEVSGDDDWFELTLEEAQTLQINLTGDGLSDPFLRLYDSNGTLIASNDDFGSLDSQLTESLEAGTYYVSARAFADSGTGTYELTAEEVQPPLPTDAIDWGSYLPGAGDGTTTINVYFVPGGDNIVIEEFGETISTLEFTQYEIDQFNLAFDEIESYIDVEFVVVTDASQADFTLALETGPSGALGFMFPQGSAGNDDGLGVFNRDGFGWDQDGGGGLERGGFGYVTIVHELGHGLGLAHPHDNGGGSTILSGVNGSAAQTDTGDFDLNQSVFTILSYVDGWALNPAGTPGTDNYGYQGTFAPLDIAVLQEAYGANTTAGAGDTVYTLADINQSGTAFESIFDNDGTDTILSEADTDTVINLNDATLIFETGGGGFISNAAGIHGGFTIANGTVIENATSGIGNDNLIGNEADNVLDSGNGDDTLIGGEGNDTLRGGSGNDTLSGNDDDDILYGGTNDDSIDGGTGNDTAYGGTGNDNLRGEAGTDTLNGEGGNDIIDGGNDADIIDGGTGADTLRGGGGDDMLEGGGGADSISAGIGNDMVDGGTGNDTILGQGGVDTINGDAGMDTLRGGSGNDVLFGGADDDTLFGQGNNDMLFGEGGNDMLSGAAGADHLFGGAGDDILNGSIGGDRLDGGAGNDVLNGGNMDGARDTFIFAVGYDQDRVNSFDQAGTDRLELDEDLWAAAGTLTAQQVVDMFGSLNATGTILTLDFGNGDILEVQSGAGIDADTLGEDILFI